MNPTFRKFIVKPKYDPSDATDDMLINNLLFMVKEQCIKYEMITPFAKRLEFFQAIAYPVDNKIVFLVAKEDIEQKDFATYLDKVDQKIERIKAVRNPSWVCLVRASVLIISTGPTTNELIKSGDYTVKFFFTRKEKVSIRVFKLILEPSIKLVLEPNYKFKQGKRVGTISSTYCKS